QQERHDLAAAAQGRNLPLPTRRRCGLHVQPPGLGGLAQTRTEGRGARAAGRAVLHGLHAADAARHEALPGHAVGRTARAAGRAEDALIRSGLGRAVFRPRPLARIQLHAEHDVAVDAREGQATSLALFVHRGHRAFDAHVQHALAAPGAFAVVDHGSATAEPTNADSVRA